jgi:CoA:oxalate CoA-transferase
MSDSYPLQGITLLDLSQIYNGPYATFLMALAGARVIKVEPPGGEPLRRRGAVGGAALPFAMLNGCKESLVLDLKTPQGKAALLDLASSSDVLVENFAPGAMDRLGLGAELVQAVNPQLIYASSSGYGRDGPYAAYPAMDLTVQAMSGAMHVTGFPDGPPVKAGPAIADFFTGIHFYGAILTALFERERTGVARRLEVAMQDSVYASLSSNLGMHWFAGGQEVPSRTANRHGGLAECPYNVYPTSDGYVSVMCVGDGHWRTLAEVMGRPELAEDPRYATLKNRVAAIDTIDSMVEQWTLPQTSAQVFETLMAARLPSAPVRDLDQVMNDPNMHARGALQRIDHPEFGPLVLMHSPLRYDGVPLRPLEPSRPLGADTERVLRERTQLSADDLAAVVARSAA